MWDRETGKSFRLDKPEEARDPIWWGRHVPLWITATQAGIPIYILCSISSVKQITPVYSSVFVCLDKWEKNLARSPQ